MLRVNLADLQQALIAAAHVRIRNGQVTVRGLARMSGVSQPHLHNVLKNLRLLSTDSADRLMRALNLSTEDLMWEAAGGSAGGLKPVPVCRTRLGPGFETPLESSSGTMPFPAGLIARLQDPVAARLAPDIAMPSALKAGDVVLLDRNPIIRTHPGGAGIWLIDLYGSLCVRYVRKGGDGHYYVVTEQNLKDSSLWRRIPGPKQTILDVVRAKVVWFGREVQEEPHRPGDPAGGCD